MKVNILALEPGCPVDRSDQGKGGVAITGWEDGDKAAIVAATKQKLRTGR